MSHKCAATVWGANAFHSWLCGRTAKAERMVDGVKKWVCGTHDPERLQGRRDRYNAALNTEYAEKKIMEDAREKIEALGRKVPEIASQYDIIDAARGRLSDAIDARRKVR